VKPLAGSGSHDVNNVVGVVVLHEDDTEVIPSSLPILLVPGENAKSFRFVGGRTPTSFPPLRCRLGTSRAVDDLGGGCG
jgi:hypothetical protein